jgi:hypothetical protein
MRRKISISKANTFLCTTRIYLFPLCCKSRNCARLFDMADESNQDLPRRMQQFTHPSGRTVHVASNPEVAETLRRQLTNTHGEDGFDLYLRGSDEHVDRSLCTQRMLVLTLCRSKRCRRPTHTRSNVGSNSAKPIQRPGTNTNACTRNLTRFLMS